MFVQVYKEGLKPHYNWSTHLIYSDKEGVVCFNRGPRDLNHQTRNRVFTFPTDVIELYWHGIPYSLHISLDRKTGVLHYYANIHSLPNIEEEEISFIDYDLDVIREDTAPAFLVDKDEFDLHKELYGYSDEILSMVPAAADHVLELLNGAPLFQKKTLLEAFEKIDRNERDFLRSWTSIPRNRPLQ